MAFLDELKKQAELKRLEEETQTQSKLAAVSQNFIAVQSKYKEIQRYLQELVNQLNVLDPDIRRPYFIEGFGLVDDFRPRDFALSIDSIRINERDFINSLVLRFKCVSEREIVIERDTPHTIEHLKDYFWRNNLKYQCTEYRNDRGLVVRAVFRVASEIPVTAKFSADFERARITLQIKNLNGLTVNEFVYEAAEIDQALLDEFAKFLLDKPNRLREMGMHQQARRTVVRPAVRPGAQGTPTPQAPTAAEGDDDRTQGGKGLLARLKSLFS